MEILIRALAGCFLVWVFLSPPLLIFYFFKANNQTALGNFCEKHSQALIGGTFFFLTAIMSFGINEILFFIPKSWGRMTDDGDYVTWRYSISSIIGFLSSIGILIIIEGYNRYKKSNLKLRKMVIVNYYFRRLFDLNKRERQKKLSMFKKEINEVCEYKMALPYNDRERLLILEDVLSKIEDGNKWGYDPALELGYNPSSYSNDEPDYDDDEEDEY